MAKYKLSKVFKGNYPITQKYGENPAAYKPYGLAAHEGVDYGTPVGVEMLCPFEKGIVLRDNDDFKNNAYGNFDVIWDPVQLCAVWFCHQSGNDVTCGQELKRGQVTGRTGNSGNSSGPHLHLNFVETDAQGNRLNKDNGYQGFLDILDPNLVEWVDVTSSTNTSMNDKRAGWFDILSKTEFGQTGWEKLTDAQINQWAKDLTVRKVGNGNWDKICASAGLPTSSTIDEVVAKLKVGCSPQEKAALREEGRLAGVEQVKKTTTIFLANQK